MAVFYTPGSLPGYTHPSIYEVQNINCVLSSVFHIWLYSFRGKSYESVWTHLLLVSSLCVGSILSRDFTSGTVADIIMGQPHLKLHTTSRSALCLMMRCRFQVCNILLSEPYYYVQQSWTSVNEAASIFKCETLAVSLCNTRFIRVSNGSFAFRTFGLDCTHASEVQVFRVYTRGSTLMLDDGWT